MEKEQYFSQTIDEQSRHKYYREHLLQYGLLVLAAVFSISVLFQLKNFFVKLLVIVLISSIYLLWGIWHHWEEKNLTSTHVLEYLVISALIFSVLVFVFL